MKIQVKRSYGQSESVAQKWMGKVRWDSVCPGETEAMKSEMQ